MTVTKTYAERLQEKYQLALEREADSLEARTSNSKAHLIEFVQGGNYDSGSYVVRRRTACVLCPAHRLSEVHIHGIPATQKQLASGKRIRIPWTQLNDRTKEKLLENYVA